MSSPMLSNWVEKNLPAFWWIYTCLGREISSWVYSLFSSAVFEVGSLLDAEEKKGISKRGFGA